MMPLFIAALWGALLQMLGTAVGKVLVSLGIGYVTFSGVQVVLDLAKTQFLSSMATAGPNTLAIAGSLKIGVCVSMLLSAVSMRLVLTGLSSAGGGTITKMVTKA